jgi:hypothetical protein
MLLTGFALLELALVVNPAFILAAETSLLASIVWPANVTGKEAGAVAEARPG